MGWRDWFKPSGGGATESVRGPSGEYPTALAAVLALIEAHPARGADDGSWLTFEGSGGGKKGVIEIAGEQLNFCTEEVELTPVLRSLGFEGLAARARAAGGADRTVWSLPGATAEELASVVDAVFVVVLGLGEGYHVSGERQQ
jgi:hypothetical protein